MNLVLFDPESPDNVYVFVTGVGLHMSSTGLAGAFRLLPGGRRYCANLVASVKGAVYVCENNCNRGAPLWSYSPASGWTSTNPPPECIRWRCSREIRRTCLRSTAMAF